MFKIDFFVDDRKLSAALLALVGIAHGQPNVVPVVNVKKKSNGALVAKTEGSGTDRFFEALKERKGETMNAADIRAMMPALGLAPKSYSYVLKHARDAKLLKRTGRGAGTATKYLVL